MCNELERHSFEVGKSIVNMRELKAFYGKLTKKEDRNAVVDGNIRIDTDLQIEPQISEIQQQFQPL